MKRSSGGGAGAKVPGLGSRREPGAAAPVLPELRLYRCAHVLRKGGGVDVPIWGLESAFLPPTPPRASSGSSVTGGWYPKAPGGCCGHRESDPV